MEPWVLFVPLVAPHCPFQVEEPWFSQYDRDALPGPVEPGDRAREPRYMQAIREAYGIEEVTDEQWREVTATYYGMISRLDDQLGRVMRAVQTAGAAESTVTLFFADHGEYLGDFGLIEKWPSALHDCVTRDPLIISAPGLGKGQTSQAMVEMVDVLPTVLELAGVNAPHRHFGRSLVPLLRDPAASHREFAFTEGGFTVEEANRLEQPSFPYDLKGELQHADPTLVGKAIAVRDARWTYVWRLYEEPELYDRTTDPHERDNLMRPREARSGAAAPARRDGALAGRDRRRPSRRGRSPSARRRPPRPRRGIKAVKTEDAARPRGSPQPLRAARIVRVPALAEQTPGSHPVNPLLSPRTADHGTVVERALARLDLDAKTRLLAGQDLWSLGLARDRPRLPRHVRRPHRRTRHRLDRRRSRAHPAQPDSPRRHMGP